MIELIPAIDIIEGKCVRLTKGDYNTKKVYGDPLEMAQQFEDLGMQRLHVVDLDGAKSKHVVNLSALRAITAHTGLIVDFGGGVKTDEDLEKVYEAGASLVTVGSIAITAPERYLKWLEKYGADRLILGADVRNGRVSINGWKEDSDVRLEDYLFRYMKEGTRNVLCTEISRDGTLTGPAIDLYRNIMELYPQCRLIASGGVGSTDDILALDAAGIPSVVFGKAFYEGKIDIKKIRELGDNLVPTRENLEGATC
jgi:phosphoribosylformimino-5-aminoimidazole carboxamide ribotide isomerase